MPKLTVTNLVAAPVGTPAYQLSDISVQDPFPAEGRLVLQVPAGTTKYANVSMDQLQRVRPQLVNLQQRGLISWTAETTDEDPRGEEADLMGGPELSVLDTGTTPITNGVANVGCVGYGSNLLMGFVQGMARMFDPANAAAWLTINAIDPGIASQDIGVVLINDAGVLDPSNIEYAETLPAPAGYGRVLEIHVLPATFTWATLAAILNDVTNGIYARTAAFPAGPFRLMCSNNGISILNPINQALQHLSAGIGVPLMLAVGVDNAIITLLWNHTVRYDVDLTASPVASGDSVIVRLRSSGGGPSALAGTGIA